ncbi:hypothetical protein FBU59_004313 [Linderina macrospora]|uniref:Uncharacterized protein n=1 Tax=Linderina macrospora TaxID=4868 RepID=A0ACC1J5X4_9FUNG|nr:hypothetical protein FBU59_004313 [Linderina macrospora]
MSPQPGPPTLYVPVVPLHDKYLPVQHLLEKYPGLRYRRFLEAPARFDTRDSGHSTLPHGPNSLPLCRWCGTETRTPGQLFCTPPTHPATSAVNVGCRHEFNVRRDAQYMRKQLYIRDGGICDQCSVHTSQMRVKVQKCTTLAGRRAVVNQWKSELNAEWGAKMRKPLGDLAERFLPGMFWEAAHIIDVQEGGGYEFDSHDSRRTAVHRLSMGCVKVPSESDLKYHAQDSCATLLEDKPASHKGLRRQFDKAVVGVPKAVRHIKASIARHIKPSPLPKKPRDPFESSDKITTPPTTLSDSTDPTPKSDSEDPSTDNTVAASDSRDPDATDQNEKDMDDLVTGFATIQLNIEPAHPRTIHRAVKEERPRPAIPFPTLPKYASPPTSFADLVWTATETLAVIRGFQTFGLKPYAIKHAHKSQLKDRSLAQIEARIQLLQKNGKL